MGLLKLLFILVIFLFTFGEIIRVPVTFLSIKLIDIGVILLAAYWVFFIIKNFKKIKINKDLGIPVLIFLFIAMFSLLLNARLLTGKEFFISFSYLIRWIAYISIIFIIPMFGNQFKKIIIKFLIFIGAFIVVLGYIQYLFYPNLRNLYYLGWDEHLYRLFSIFLDPNFAGAFLALYFLFLLDLTFNSFKDKRRFIVLGFLLTATFFATLLTYSRSAFIMLIVGVFVYLIFKKRLMYIGAIVLLFVVLTFFLPKAYKTEGTNFLRTASAEARIDSAIQSIDIFKKNPVFGVGFNALRYAKERYGYNPSSFSHADAGTDNSFLFLLATTGITGFVAYLFMWFKVLKRNIKSKLLIASIAALFVDSLFVNSLFYSFLMFWIWTLVGLYGE